MILLVDNMNKAMLLIVPVLTLLATAATQHQQQQIARATPIRTNFGTTVQTHTGDGFDNGYNKGRADSIIMSSVICAYQQTRIAITTKGDP